VRLLLDSVQPAAYVPVDISADFLHEAALKLGAEFPWLRVHAVCADFASPWHSRTTLPAGRRVIFYPGSTIGNMDPADARGFLAGMRGWIGDDGGIIIGVDLHKPATILDAAYNDEQGVTAKFNLNILSSMNRLADADFDPDTFSHRAFYNEELRRIEMHLVSKTSQTVHIHGNALHFERGETLHTENSYKYTPETFAELSEAAGFTLIERWVDDEGLFSVQYLAAA
jgi:dimethylhistidine N-methyltransferase